MKYLGLKNNIISIMFFILLDIGLIYPQSTNTNTITKRGTTAAQFLKIGVDARATAMGNAFTAMNGDLSNIYWNPAGLAYIDGIQAMFVNSPWIAETNFNYLAFAFNSPGIGTLGFSLTSLTVPEDIVRTVEEPEGTGERFEAGDLAVTLSYSRRLTDKFSLGGNLKFVQQNIWHSKAQAIAADLGALFVTPFRDIRIGASLSNFGNSLKMDGRDMIISVDPDKQNEGNVEFVNALYQPDQFPLPLIFRVGIAGELLENEKTRLSFGLDALHPNDNTESMNAGLEFAYAETFFLRSGYATLFRDATEQGLTLGGGIYYRLGKSNTKLKLDYSYTDFGRFDFIQRLTIGLRL